MTDPMIVQVVTPPALEICFLWVHRWFPDWWWLDTWWLCMTKGEWAAWSQTLGTLLAVATALLAPYAFDAWSRRRAREAHLVTVATDALLADRQVQVYLKDGVPVPAYRLLLAGPERAMPALLAEGRLTSDQARALVQYYTDARSFNYSLDLAQGRVDADASRCDLARTKVEIMKSRHSPPPPLWKSEVDRTRQKARHLTTGKQGYRTSFDELMVALSELGLSEEKLKRIAP